MSKTPELYAKAVELSTAVDENFLELARTLRELQDSDAEEFRRAVKNSGLGQRKAYYLVTIDRTFSKIPVPKTRLKRIGWTKLNILSKHISKSNYGELLKKAEQHTAKELEAILRGEEPMTNAHTVLFYFTPTDYEELASALIKHGAYKSGRGLVNKEQALLNLVREMGRQE